MAGGSLYVSDFAYDALEAAVPDLVDFAGDDAIQDAAEVGSVTLLPGRVVNADLLRWMPPRPTFNVNLVAGYAVIDGYGPNTAVEVLSEQSTPVRPLLVSVPTATLGALNSFGTLVYTAYHYTASQVDPAAQTPLIFAIFGL